MSEPKKEEFIRIPLTHHTRKLLTQQKASLSWGELRIEIMTYISWCSVNTDPLSVGKLVVNSSTKESP